MTDRPLLRPCTPDRVETTDDGRTLTFVTLKRYCPRGHLVGDATDAEVLAVSRGLDLPSAALDCVACRDALTAP